MAAAVSASVVLVGAVTAAPRPIVITGWGAKPVDANGNYTLCVSVKGDPRTRLAGWMAGGGISGPGETVNQGSVSLALNVQTTTASGTARFNFTWDSAQASRDRNNAANFGLSFAPPGLIANPQEWPIPYLTGLGLFPFPRTGWRIRHGAEPYPVPEITCP